MNPTGIWIRFKFPGPRQDHEAKWISIGRTWFLELRDQLKAAWREEFGLRSAAASPRDWVAAQLAKMGVRLIGKEAVHLPYALYLKVWVAEGGDSKGPQGKWQVLETIAPERRPPPGAVSVGRRNG